MMSFSAGVDGESSRLTTAQSRLPGPSTAVTVQIDLVELDA